MMANLSIINRVEFFRKSVGLGKKPKNSSKIGFFAFCQKSNPLMSFFTFKMGHNSIIYDSAKTPCLGKLWFFSQSDCSVLLSPFFEPLVQSYCRILWSSVSLEGINIQYFLLGDNHQRKAAFETTTFGWVRPVVSLPFIFQGFLHGDSHQGKVASVTTHSVHWLSNPPPSPPISSFFLIPPLKSVNRSSPLFRQSPLYIGFS